MILRQSLDASQYRLCFDSQRGELTYTPRHWKDDPLLAQAVDIFYQVNGPDRLTREHLKRLCKYAHYYMSAPCWDVDSEDEAEQWAALRNRLATVTTREQMDKWLYDLCHFGLFPFAEERL